MLSCSFSPRDSRLIHFSVSGQLNKKSSALGASVERIICFLDLRQRSKDSVLPLKKLIIIFIVIQWWLHALLLIPIANEFPRRTWCSPRRVLFLFPSSFSVGADTGRIIPSAVDMSMLSFQCELPIVTNTCYTLAESCLH